MIFDAHYHCLLHFHILKDVEGNGISPVSSLHRSNCVERNIKGGYINFITLHIAVTIPFFRKIITIYGLKC